MKIANGQKKLFTFFSATMGLKYVKSESKTHRKQLISCEFLQKLLADFSKTILKKIKKYFFPDTSTYYNLTIIYSKFYYSIVSAILTIE